MMNVELTNKNFMVYAMKAYNNPNCMDLEEFQEDLKRIKYIKRLFKKCEDNMLNALKTFLVFLNYMRDDEHIDIQLDQKIVKELREL